MSSECSGFAEDKQGPETKGEKKKKQFGQKAHSSAELQGLSALWNRKRHAAQSEQVRPGFKNAQHVLVERGGFEPQSDTSDI